MQHCNIKQPSTNFQYVFHNCEPPKRASFDTRFACIHSGKTVNPASQQHVASINNLCLDPLDSVNEQLQLLHPLIKAAYPIQEASLMRSLEHVGAHQANQVLVMPTNCKRCGIRFSTVLNLSGIGLQRVAQVDAKEPIFAGNAHANTLHSVQFSGPRSANCQLALGSSKSTWIQSRRIKTKAFKMITSDSLLIDIVNFGSF